VPRPVDRTPEDPLPLVRSVIVTWTAAEAQALWDVLDAPEATPYARNYSNYHPNLSQRSPALEAKCLARIAQVSDVLLVHSMLHLATDDDTLPLRRLLAHIILETHCERIITTGTAGGIGADAQLGDVVLGSACKFNCQKAFKNAPFASSSYQTTYSGTVNAVSTSDLAAMLGANIDQLTSMRTPVPGDMPVQISAQEIETTDFFAFDTSTDHYGLRAYDPAAGAVEMDDATLGLVIADNQAFGEHVPLWAAVRNASDPQADMTKYATEEDAASAMGLIYRRYGYWTSIPSVIISWLMAVG
jgi:hypothetical protein